MEHNTTTDVRDGPAIIDGRKVWVCDGVAVWHDGFIRLSPSLKGHDDNNTEHGMLTEVDDGP